MKFYAPLISSALLLSSNIFAWDINTSVTDASGGAMSDPFFSTAFTPNSFAHSSSELPPDSAASVDLLAGKLQARATYPVGGGTQASVFASANINSTIFINDSDELFTLPNGDVGLDITGVHHLESLVPTNTGPGTGVKTSFARYTSILQARNLTTSDVNTSIFSGTKTSTWDENGDFLSEVYETPTMLGLVTVNEFSRHVLDVRLEMPALSWGSGDLFDLSATLTVQASADDPGLWSDVDAFNTATLFFVLPEGVRPDDGLLTLSELSWVSTTVVPLPAAIWMLGAVLLGLVGVRGGKPHAGFNLKPTKTSNTPSTPA